MRVKMRLSAFLILLIGLGSAPAFAQALSSASVEQSLAAFLGSFPGGEQLAITAICIAAGTFLLRLTKWLGLALTFATFGFLAVALLLAAQPQALARLFDSL
jgi:hypothetical protein